MNLSTIRSPYTKTNQKKQKKKTLLNMDPEMVDKNITW